MPVTTWMPASVAVLGGTGFLGRHIVACLLRDGAAVRVVARRPGRLALATGGNRLESVAADIRDAAALAAAVAGAEGAVNAVSAYVETGGITYPAIHEQGAGNLARACANQGVRRLVHISGIGADPTSPSRYIGARGRGEAIVRETFPDATILRPSVIFGPEDAFLNALATVIRSAPVVPLIGGGQTRLQPVHVLDVAEAACRTLADPAAGGRVYELGGAEAVSLAEIMARIAARLGRRPAFLPIPFVLARPAARLMELLPRAPLTLAQVELLASDNLPAGQAPGLAQLGIAPRRLDEAIAALAR